MDYTAISCGIAGQEKMSAVKDANEKINIEIKELFKDGYRRFLLALTGETVLLFAENALDFREEYPDMGIDILIPFDGWIEQQKDSERYKAVTLQAESVHFSCEEEYEDSNNICNTQLLGFGRCLTVIHDGNDKAMAELIEESCNAEQNVKEIRL